MKKICLILIVVITLLVFLASTLLAFETEKTLTLTSAGLRELRIDSGAGTLKVAGSASADKIEVRARIRTEGRDDDEQADFIADHMTLTLEKRGDRAVLTSAIESQGGFFFSRDAGIDLDIVLPKSLTLDIDDGSGEIAVMDIDADVMIEDGSGRILVERVAGRLEIEDNSGEIEIRDITGDVSIDDGSGEITIVKVEGSVTVDDGSGRIEIRDVGRDVLIEEAGSGGVRIDNVKGRVIRHDDRRGPEAPPRAYTRPARSGA